MNQCKSCEYLRPQSYGRQLDTCAVSGDVLNSERTEEPRPTLKCPKRGATNNQPVPKQTPTIVERIQATREGGAVQRCHVTRHENAYDVAQHTYGALNLLLLLHPGPSTRLIKAVLWHDVVERWTGDTPATAKWMCPELRAALKLLEEPLLKHFELHQELPRDEECWLAGVDILELWLWCRENQRESHPRQIMNTCEWFMLRNQDKLPKEVLSVFSAMRGTEHQPLPDMFDGLVQAKG